MYSRMLLFLALPLFLVGAGDAPLDRATLRGLDAVNVVVDHVDPALQKEEITQGALQARVAERLRAAGIKVDDKAASFVGLRVLHVREGRFSPYALSLNLGAYQQVTLVRDPKVKTSTQTWEVETVLAAGSKVVYRACMNSVDELADRFIAAWRQANGK
jgi:hypothetical protein